MLSGNVVTIGSISSALQVAGTSIAAVAAIASWASVATARKAASEARSEAAERRRPQLLLAFEYSGPGLAGVSLHNAGGGVAKSVVVYMFWEHALARADLSFLRPGEEAGFRVGSEAVLRLNDRKQSGHFEGVAVAAESYDRHYMLWNEEGDRFDFALGQPRPTTFPDMLATFGHGERNERDRRGTSMERIT